MAQFDSEETYNSIKQILEIEKELSKYITPSQIEDAGKLGEITKLNGLYASLPKAISCKDLVDFCSYLNESKMFYGTSAELKTGVDGFLKSLALREKHIPMRTISYIEPKTFSDDVNEIITNQIKDVIFKYHNTLGDVANLSETEIEDAANGFFSDLEYRIIESFNKVRSNIPSTETAINDALSKLEPQVSDDVYELVKTTLMKSIKK